MLIVEALPHWYTMGRTYKNITQWNISHVTFAVVLSKIWWIPYITLEIRVPILEIHSFTVGFTHKWGSAFDKNEQVIICLGTKMSVRLVVWYPIRVSFWKRFLEDASLRSIPKNSGSQFQTALRVTKYNWFLKGSSYCINNNFTLLAWDIVRLTQRPSDLMSFDWRHFLFRTLPIWTLVPSRRNSVAVYHDVHRDILGTRVRDETLAPSLPGYHLTVCLKIDDLGPTKSADYGVMHCWYSTNLWEPTRQAHHVIAWTPNRSSLVRIPFRVRRIRIAGDF